MRIWLDCSSLMSWHATHLTGIQRTVLGVHKGWRAIGIEPRLFRYHHGLNEYIEITHGNLPELVRRNIESHNWATIETAANTEATAKDKHDEEAGLFGEEPKLKSLKQLVGRAVLGQGNSSQTMRAALAEASMAMWKLRNETATWLPERLGLRRPGPSPADAISRDKAYAISGETPIFARTGDYLFSIGGECFQPGYNIHAAHTYRQKGARVIRMIYDIIPIVRPQWVPNALVDVFKEWTIETITSSDHLLTISDYSRKDILRFASAQGLNLPPIDKIRLGDSIQFDPQTLIRQPDAIARPSRIFFLCLGTIEPRKNHRLLYDAWRRLAKEDSDGCPDLVCIGGHHEMSAQLIHEIRSDPMVKDRIMLLDGIDDWQLDWYYDHCIATLYPSLYEGWGLPVAESLARGKLCLASNATSIPEISDAPVFFDPEDPEALAWLIKQTVTDQSWREDATMAASSFTPTTWETTAKEILTKVVR